MIDSESQSQAMQLERLWELAIARNVGDSVLYHSVPGLASARVQFVGYRNQSIGEFVSDLLRTWLELRCGVFP
jgi:hypothetical protein